MLSSSNATWKCAQLSESLGSRPEQPLMCCGSWTRASQCPNFLPQIHRHCWVRASLSPGLQPDTGNRTCSLLAIPSPGTHQSPRIQLSFLRIYPILSILRATVSSVRILIISHLKYYNSLSVPGLPSSTTPLSLPPPLFLLHKSCPESYFSRWKSDHVPPFLSLPWLPINLHNNDTITPWHVRKFDALIFPLPLLSYLWSSFLFTVGVTSDCLFTYPFPPTVKWIRAEIFQNQIPLARTWHGAWQLKYTRETETWLVIST